MLCSFAPQPHKTKTVKNKKTILLIKKPFIRFKFALAGSVFYVNFFDFTSIGRLKMFFKLHIFYSCILIFKCFVAFEKLRFRYGKA